MRRGHRNQHAGLADDQASQAVDQRHLVGVKLPVHGLRDFAQLSQRHRLVRLIVQVQGLPPFGVVSHDAFKAQDCSLRWRLELFHNLGDPDGFANQRNDVSRVLRLCRGQRSGTAADRRQESHLVIGTQARLPVCENLVDRRDHRAAKPRQFRIALRVPRKQIFQGRGIVYLRILFRPAHNFLEAPEKQNVHAHARILSAPARLCHRSASRASHRTTPETVPSFMQVLGRAGGGKVKVLISGSTGLVGTALRTTLHAHGHDVLRLIRPATRREPLSASAGERDVAWNPGSDEPLDPAAEDADAVVHLAGASIGDGRWTAPRKTLLRDSRVAGTHHLVAALAKLRRPPRVFIAASAIGFYGDRGDELLTESSAPGADFLAALTRDWEAESVRAVQFGARVVTLRFGIILAKHGGALPRMALPFRLGAGGRIASGKQWMSWVTLEDIVGIIGHAAATENLSGPVNAVAPHPARNAEFAAALGRVLRRPAIFPAPGFALRLALGEMAGALLFSSQRVQPQKLQQSGYRFLHPDLVPALQAVLK